MTQTRTLEHDTLQAIVFLGQSSTVYYNILLVTIASWFVGLLQGSWIKGLLQGCWIQGLLQGSWFQGLLKGYSI